MTDEERRLGKLYVEAWKRAGAVMQQLRDADIRAADTARAMAVFKGAALAGIVRNPPKPTSGLIEQQRWFMKAGRDE
jgi:hypothetical protein